MNKPRYIFRRLLKASALGLLLLVLLDAGVFLLRDQLLQDVLRPLVVRELSRRFQLELTIERMLLNDGVVRVEQLRVEDDAFGRLELPLLEFGLDWEGLRDRRLRKLVLTGPRLTMPAEQSDSKAATTAWPERPPLVIDAFEIRAGELLNPADAGQSWRIDGKGMLARRWRLELHLQSAAAAAQTLDVQANGSWDGAIRGEVSRLQWLGRELLGEPLQLALADGSLIELNGELQLAQLSDADLRPLLGAFDRSLPETLSWRAEGLRVRPTLVEGDLRLVAQLAALKLGNEGQRVLLHGLELEGQAAAGQPLEFELNAGLGSDAGSVVLVGRLAWANPPTLELARFDWRGQSLLARPLRLSWQGGDIAFAAALRLAELDDRSLRPLLALADIQLLPGPQWSVRELVLNPSWDGEQLRLGMTVASAVVRSGQRKVKLGPVALNLNGRPGNWQLQGEGKLGGQSRLEGHLQLQGEMLEGRAELKSADLAEWQQALPGAGLPALAGVGSATLRFSGSASRPSLVGEVSVRGLTLQDSTGFPALDLQAGFSLEGRQADWRLHDGALTGTLSGTLEGALAGTFSGRLGGDGWSVRLAELKVEKPTWTAPDGLSAYAGERMLLQGEFAAAPGKSASFELAGELAGGELLHGAYYASVKELSVRFGLRGEIVADSWCIQSAHVQVPQVGELSLHGYLGTADSRLQATLSLPNLRQALERHGRNLLGESFPELQELSLDGGLDIRADGRRNAQGWGLRLNLELRQVTLDWGERGRLAGLNGMLPLQLGNPDAAEELSGKLAWSGLRFGLLQAGAGELAVLSRPGRLRFPGALRLGLAGGELILADLDLILPPQALEISTRVTVADVELPRLNQELGWPEMDGTLGADLGRLHYRSGELSIAGEAEIEVFAGRISVRNMQVKEPFSRYPVFLADIDFSGIDLYRLTKTFSFGEMNGVIDGYVHQLRVFGATPTRFEARLSTRKSGTRNISVKALNNLSILSQGGLSAALSRGIYRFIDFYRYRSIGIVCSLENDQFRMRGTALEGSDRYLVYGGLLPPRIDVVSSSPTVSFREMVKRLKRIDRTGSSGSSR